MSHNTHRVSAAVMTAMLVTIFATACTTASTQSSQFLSDNSSLGRTSGGAYVTEPSLSENDLFFQQMLGE